MFLISVRKRPTRPIVSEAKSSLFDNNDREPGPYPEFTGPGEESVFNSAYLVDVFARLCHVIFAYANLLFEV